MDSRNMDLGLKPRNYDYYKIQKEFLSEKSLSNENYLKTRVNNVFELDKQNVNLSPNLVQHYLMYKEAVEKNMREYAKIVQSKQEEIFYWKKEFERERLEKEAVKEYANKLKEENLKIIEIIKVKDAKEKQECQKEETSKPFQSSSVSINAPKSNVINMKAIKKFKSEQSLLSRSSVKSSMWRYSKKSQSDSTIRVYDESEINESRLGSTHTRLEESLITDNRAISRKSGFQDRNRPEQNNYDEDGLDEENMGKLFVINKSKYSNVGRYIKKITGNVFKSKGVEAVQKKKITKRKRLHRSLFES